MTIGEQIAAEFSRDKVDLNEAEQRRLAGMIDAATKGRAELLAAATEALEMLREFYFTAGDLARLEAAIALAESESPTTPATGKE